MAALVESKSKIIKTYMLTRQVNRFFDPRNVREQMRGPKNLTRRR